MRYRVSMDIGGTFTDIVVHDTDTGIVRASKADTTPGDLTEGVLAAIAQLDVPADEIASFVHGTTQGLNALLERRGAKVLLATSEGMRDVYTIARGNRTRMFDIHYRKPTPLVGADDTVEIGGRLRHDGSELRPLDEASVRDVAARARAGGYDAIAVCLLFAYANEAHELEVERMLRDELGDDVVIVLSHRVAREWREYERTSSTVLEAYTGPVVRRYLERIESRFTDEGITSGVQVMQSSGGIVGAAYAAEHPLQTLLSGPVGGTAGGAALMSMLGRDDAICIDMGGTSFDASLVLDGRPDISSDGTADGFPVLMPLVNLHTIGAGGGSVAYAEAGALRVGPRSAGAQPGPACYGRGGTEPTVTDANAVLGRVDPDWFAGGRMSLDVAAAHDAVGLLAAGFGMEAVDLAEGILDIANAKMAQAIRTLTVEHGREPADFALVAFGGAGPMHAEAIARELGLAEVLIPEFPGAFSAWGMLGSDVRRDLSAQHYVHQNELDRRELAASVQRLIDSAGEELGAQRVPTDRRRFEQAVDMRYEGQDYTLTVLLDDPAEPARDDFLERVAERFGRQHAARYGHATPEAPVEFVSVRVTGFGVNEFGHLTGERHEAAASVTRTVPIVFDRATHQTPVLRRDALPIGETLAGPVLVVEETTTTVVSPRASIRRESAGHLVLELNA
ncbi:hydantoinase/oxoprolinase family protein [Agromyces binzhouensis]|uniref:Hydantoinase/oxoprolinase family protein n=1 Tax=Agromyces binzhouensis TaxID=1817495 RepID=A0A4Q2JWM4_9MICO|nr:hydantoinase/oxoprolinase family protein [Agromyces binzhouensis]RXZ51636.1 hydantoinase/oxoprolinase family protein [Agromyces binzhouensis]